MITRRPYLPAADDDTVIWHYMSIANFFYLLNRELLYFSRVDYLEDKAEILVSDIEKEYWKDVLDNDLEPWIAYERKRIFINCWIKSNCEISTMWSAYAQQGTGVAIKTRVNKLIESYKGDEPISIIDVNYIDHKKQTVQYAGDPINVLRFFSTKRYFYEAEQELRLIYNSAEKEFDYFTIPIVINSLIEEVHVGPNAGEDVLNVIQLVVSAKGCLFPVYSSELLYP